MQKGPFKLQPFNLLIFSSATFLSLAAFSSPRLQAQETKSPATATATQASTSEFKLRSQSNVVVVRVLVRDSKGRAVGGLWKQDFRIRDNDQPQVISGFSVERPAVAPAAGAGLKASKPAEAPANYLAFYVDGRGLALQARKGYFAPKGQESPEELARDEMRKAMSSPYPIQGPPLTVHTEVHKAGAQNEEIEVQAQLGIGTLPFQKQGDRNVDTVEFAVGLFDHDGKYVTGRQFTYALALKDDTLAEMEKSGLSLKASVSAKAGSYTLRVVVRDSQGGQLAALSKAVEVPSETAAPAAKQPGTTAALNTPTAVASPANAPTVKLDVAPGQVAIGAHAGGLAALHRPASIPVGTYLSTATLTPPGEKVFFEDYKHAKPITEWSLKKARRLIPQLKGIEPATDQSPLPEILRGVSANLQKFVASFVDTSAVENIDEAETPPSGTGPARYVMPFTKHLRQKYSYLILRRQEGGAFNLVEYRTRLHGQKERRQNPSGEFIKTAGFAAMPLFFGPLQQSWSDFRYLGRQKVGGVNTEVVAFAEHVDRAGVMGHFILRGQSVPLLVQGVAWIRTGDYQILQMRTDLLASLPPLTKMTAVIHLAKIRFPDCPTVLWLPKGVEVKVDYGGYVFSNRHTYSDYRLFRASSVIKARDAGNQQH